MAKTVHAASAAALAALLLAAPAMAQTVIVPAPAQTVVTPVPTVVVPAPTVVQPAPTAIVRPAPVVVAPPPPVMAEPVTTYPVDPNLRMQQPYVVQGGVQPRHPPVTAMPSGPGPADPREYATDTPITVTGHVDGVSHMGGVTSFRLQTPTEAWTVVVPGDAGRIGRSATVTGYPHVEVRNQLLAQSIR
ncbi:hypothetical protein FFK22_027550 [Mycobacterium sp. KBS0706]|uniref:hypothetical protein n=1 Tax=Mycobacterium sp. KBS0706 TaxID=2578109 RepID=UPI00110F8942|nr:hypothetical protein [Mycobacterium sp. KBS0706]TSD85431.1 hypothetical protein FFK22_027550 [Mycobacterium sp. KBS0706]